MIAKENLMSLLKELDSELYLESPEGIVREIVIYGGAAMILMEVPNRATFDIDIFDPSTVDQVFEKVKNKIAQKYSFNRNWINATGGAFKHELMSKWEERTKVFYQGEKLIVKTLGRVDLLVTKFLAELDRGEDFEDLKNLNPTLKELDQVKAHLETLEDSEFWQKKINEVYEVLVSG